MIAISRTTGKVTKLLWDVGGQNGADLLWVPTDGSNHILVAAQNSIYVGEDFWPSVYRVDVTNGRKRVVLRGRSGRSEEHTSELQSLMRISYAVFCLKKKTISTHTYT